MIDAGIQALLLLMEPERLLYMFIGIGIGFVVGFLPGIGSTIGMAIVLPFIFGMDPYAGIALLIGVIAVNNISDTFTAVLFGIPGSASSQATIMDGFPLAQRGESARALGAAFFSSMLGGLIGAVVLFLAIPIAKPLILSFGSPELLMLSLFGLSMISLMVGKKPIRGIIVGILGLMLGTVGAAPAVPVYRYTFDWLYLSSGIHLVIAVSAFFALPEMIEFITKNKSISRTSELASGRLRGAKDAIKNWFLIVRNSVLAAILGIIPGLGGSTVEWLGYYLGKKTVKDEYFGKGDIRGVIAPEGCNNAKDGGGMIPTLLFGIPTSGSAAVLLGGLVLMGIQAGPNMVTTNLSVTLSIVWTLAIANIVGTAIAFMSARKISLITTINPNKFVPYLLVLICLGTYQSTQHWGDLVILLVFGAIGWIMRELDWPRIPFIIGFFLSAGSERYLYISMSRFGFEWLQRPGVIIIGILILIVLFGGTIFKIMKSKKDSNKRWVIGA